MITQRELKELVNYDLDTGLFSWKIGRAGAKQGAICGSLTKKGYIDLMLLRKPYATHRLAFLYMNGSMPSGEVDHINHIKDDNRWDNLRDVNHFDNQKNRKLFKNNKSGVTGVNWNKQSSKWYASIQVNRKSFSLGLYCKMDDAIKARKDAEVKYGFHINHGNSPQGRGIVLSDSYAT